MKTSIILILAMLSYSVAWAETTCQSVEYPDRTEAICIGDEKAVPEQNSLAPRTQPSSVERTIRQTPPVSATTSTPPVTTQAQPVSTPSPSNTNPAVVRQGPETAAEHLARRKALAERNSLKLLNSVAPSTSP